MSAVIRSDHVAHNPERGNFWCYYRQWNASFHAQDATRCFFDIENSADWPEELALGYAHEHKWPDIADNAILEVWRCGLMH